MTQLSRVLVVVPFLLVCSVAAQATELSGSSTTIPYFFEEANAGEEDFFAPLYEYLTFNMVDIEDTGVSMYGSGWGRLDLGERLDPKGDSIGDADLTYGFLRWSGWENRVHILAGRHFVNQGVTSEKTDALELNLDTPIGLGVSGFGGFPVHSRVGDRDGDASFGGRLFYHYLQWMEIGLSYGQLREAGRTDMENVGVDLFANLANYADVAGHAYYDVLFQKFYDISAIGSAYPIRDLKLQVHYDQRTPSAYLGKTSFFSVFSLDEVRDIGGGVVYMLMGNIYLDADYSRILHNTGSGNNRYGAGVAYYYDDTILNGVGVGYKRLDGDTDYSYHQARAYWYHLFLRSLSASADVVATFLDEEHYDVTQSIYATGSLGYTILEGLEILGSMNYAKTPYYEGELRGLLRLSYNGSITF